MKKLLPSLHALCVSGALSISGAALADIPTVRVEARPTAIVHTAEATLEAVNQATIASRVAGRIVDLPVDAGDRVGHGDIVLRIDAAEADQALAASDAAVAQAQASLANARADHDRARSLLSRNFVSQSAVDHARTAVLAAEAQLRAARAGREQASTARAYTTIASPISGVVSMRHVEAGEMAMPGAPLLTIFDPAAMRAVVDVPQSRVGSVAGGVLGASVELPDLNRRIEAARVTVLPAADARTHTLRLRVDLPSGLEGVVPGSFARVHFTTGETATIRVPVEAVLRRSEITGVYVVDERNAFSLRQIRTGPMHADGTVEVLAGLIGGEEIALDPIAAGIVARAARAAAR